MVKVCLFPHSTLLLVPVVDRPFLLFFHNALLVVCKPVVDPAILALISKLE